MPGAATAPLNCVVIILPPSLDYDVIIVGAGPAGIFTALELVAGAERIPGADDGPAAAGLRLLILEKGGDLKSRCCVVQERGGNCARCSPCRLLCGWGGAGAYSDGKLTLTPEVGGFLHQYTGKDELANLIDYVDRAYLRFGASAALYGSDEARLSQLQRQAAMADLVLIPAPIRHLGTDRCAPILEGMRQFIGRRAEIRTDTPVAAIDAADGRVCGVTLQDGTRLRSRYVVCAPGREGTEWFSGEAERLGLHLAINPVDIGVRVELPAVILEPLTEHLYESKLVYYAPTFDDQVRTFCVCPQGEVVMENYSGLLTVNGHSYAERKTDRTNFALLVSKTFTEPFREPLAYGRYIGSLANILSGGVLVQRLGDLLAGRRSTPRRIRRGLVQPTLEEAVPGDLSLVLPYRILISILEMLQALNRVAPGVHSQHTLLYGVETKFYSARLELDRGLETPIANLFAAGDGAGVTHGLVQASASGVRVARQILAREA